MGMVDRLSDRSQVLNPIAGCRPAAADARSHKRRI